MIILFCVCCAGPLASDHPAADRTGQELCALCETTVDPEIPERGALEFRDVEATR